MPHLFFRKAIPVAAVLIFLFVAASNAEAVPPTGVQWNQSNFQFRDDDGGEVTATGWGFPDAVKDQHLTFNTPEKLGSGFFRLRFAIRAQQDGGTITPRLEFKVTSVSEGCGGAEEWRFIPAGGDIFSLRDSPQFLDQAPTTQQVSSGSGFVSGFMLNTSNPAPSKTLLKNEKTEYEWSLQDVYGFTRGVVYTFRVTNNGVPLHIYSICPEIVFPFPEHGSQVPPTRVSFSGQAWPGAKITIIQKGPGEERPLKQDIVVSETGAFDVKYEGILQSEYTYGLIIADQEGRISQVKTYNIDTIHNSLTAKEILVPPTHAFTRAAVTRGGFIKTEGFASPKNKVKIELDKDIIYETKADESGKYEIMINTARLHFGRHAVRVKQEDAATKKESDFSLLKNFNVSSLLVVQADLNGDGKIDVKDLSVFLARWKDKKDGVIKNIDLNGDGKIDISDLGVFLRAFKK